jgi:hypothetical protein
MAGSCVWVECQNPDESTRRVGAAFELGDLVPFGGCSALTAVAFDDETRPQADERRRPSSLGDGFERADGAWHEGPGQPATGWGTFGASRPGSAGLRYCAVELQSIRHPVAQGGRIGGVFTWPSGFRHACRCCGYWTLDANSKHHVCHVCFWEDDGSEELIIDRPSDANRGLTLAEARRNFAQFGVADPTDLKHQGHSGGGEGPPLD